MRTRRKEGRKDGVEEGKNYEVMKEKRKYGGRKKESVK